MEEAMKRTILRALESNKKILRQFVSAMSPEERARRIRDYWTIDDHIDHLVECQRLLLARIELFLREEAPVMVPYQPDEQAEESSGRKPVDERVAEFCELRDRQIRLVRKAGKSVWKKLGSHEEYSTYTFEILLRHIALHDSFHMYRMEELWLMKEEYIKELK
jgi:uncharacterized damage-inducible protein DinB